RGYRRDRYVCPWARRARRWGAARGDGDLLRRRALAALASDAFRVAVSIDDAGPDRGPLSDRGERRGGRPILPGRHERDDDDGRASVSAFARYDESQALLLYATGRTVPLLSAAI